MDPDEEVVPPRQTPMGSRRIHQYRPGIGLITGIPLDDDEVTYESEDES